MKRILVLIMLLASTSVGYCDPEIFANFDSGRQTVTTAGTRVQLSTTSTACTRVVITAETDNTNAVTVGGSGVVGALATRQGVPLLPGDSLTVRVNNLNKIYLDAITDTEGVSYVFYY